VIDTRFRHARGPPNGILGHFHFLNFFLRRRAEKLKKIAKFWKRDVTKPNGWAGKWLIQDSIMLGAPPMEFWVISTFWTFSSDAGVKSKKKKLPNFENTMSQNLMGELESDWFKILSW
jgi:hypothetical protein